MSLFRVTSPAASKPAFCSTLLLLFGFALASSQAAPSNILPTEHYEKSDDAPMYIFRKGVSAQMISQQGPFTSYQVNVSSTETR